MANKTNTKTSAAAKSAINGDTLVTLPMPAVKITATMYETPAYGAHGRALASKAPAAFPYGAFFDMPRSFYQPGKGSGVGAQRATLTTAKDGTPLLTAPMRAFTRGGHDIPRDVLDKAAKAGAAALAALTKPAKVRKAKVAVTPAVDAPAAPPAAE